MRVFTTEVKDDKTRHSVILTECKNENEALQWLSDTLVKYKVEIYRTEEHISGMKYIWTGKWNKTSYSKCRMFYYDPIRNMLLGE